MPDDADRTASKPAEDLVLPQEGEGAEGGSARKPVEIPEPTKTSGLVRRQVSVGELQKRSRPQPRDPEAWKGGEEGGRREEEERRRPAQRMPVGATPLGRAGGHAVEPEAPEPPARPVPARDEAAVGLQSPSGSEHPRPAGAEAPRRRHRGEWDEEAAWTGNRSSLWFVLAGLVCVALVGYFLASGLEESKRRTVFAEPEERNEPEGSIEEIPIAEFVRRSSELLPVVAEVLDQAVRSEGEAWAKLVRGGAATMERRKQWQERGVKTARHLPVTNRQLHAAAVGGTGYLVLAGLDAEHLLAAAYFVKSGDDFLHDWEASEGYSELVPGEAGQLEDDEPKLMRVVVMIATFYTDQFPEEEYSCYSFHHVDPGVFVWGYAKRDSLVDRSLKASFAAPDLTGTERRATIRARKGPEGARPNQLEVVEFLHTDWLTP